MSERFPQLTKEFLEEQRNRLGRTGRDIAKEVGCSEGLVSLKLKEYGLRDSTPAKYVGKEFGNLLVLSVDGSRDSNYHLLANCKCLNCGRSCEVNISALRSGNTKSCGCLGHPSGYRNKNFLGFREISLTYWNSVNHSAEVRGFELQISIEEAWDLFIRQDRRCALSGVEIAFAGSRHGQSQQTASLDRIDSKHGYTIDNVQWVHKVVNRIKQAYTEAEFVEWCRLISAHRAANPPEDPADMYWI